MDKVILKGLCDRLYEKRKTAALDLERSIRKLLEDHDIERINAIIDELCDADFSISVEKSVARIARLMGLAASVIALGPLNIPLYLNKIIPSILICFGDQNDQVRFYACESLYNIAKIAKGEMLIYFNEIFDILCKITSDQVSSVKGAASLLDKLIKDIVGELASNYISIVKSADLKDLPQATKTNTLTGEVLQERYEQDSKNLAFSLPKFIPLLQERIYVNNPNTRMFLVSWIQVLANCPDLELVTYLPAFLGGLFAYLSDSHRDVRVVTSNLLDQFLQEIKRISELKKLISIDMNTNGSIHEKAAELSNEMAMGSNSNTNGTQASMRQSSDESNLKKLADGPLISERKKNLITALEQWTVAPNETDTSNSTSLTTGSAKSDLKSNVPAQQGTVTTDEHEQLSEQGTKQREPIYTAPSTQPSKNGQDYVPGQNVVLDFPKFIQVLIVSLNSSEPKVQIVVLKWLETILNLSPKGFLSTLSNLLPLLLKHLSDSNNRISEMATTINYKLIDVTGKLDYGEKVNYSSMVNNLSLNFKEGNSTTKIACLDWLIFIYKKISGSSMEDYNDSIFYILLQSLSDTDDRVISKSLALLSCICSNGNNDQYFANFVYKVLDLLKNDTKMLKKRASFILRQLCVQLGAERIYKITSLTLDKWDKSESSFVKMVIQILSTDLITAPDLRNLRNKLKKNEDWSFFSIIFKCWCHNSSSLLYLCLISENYELAYNVLQIFVEQDMINSSKLTQIDILVQYLESPVFASLRMQLLEHQKYPYLYKCLFAILMILPQSRAYDILNKRLSTVIQLVSINNMSSGFAFTPSSSPSVSKPEINLSTRSLSGTSSASRSITQNNFQFNDLLEYFRNVSANYEGAYVDETIKVEPVLKSTMTKHDLGKSVPKHSVSNRISSISRVYEPSMPSTPQVSTTTFNDSAPPVMSRKLSSSTYSMLRKSESQDGDTDSVIFNPSQKG